MKPNRFRLPTLRSLLSVVPFIVMAISVGSLRSADASEVRSFSADQLNKIAAPIALYPDALLIQVVKAASHPYDIAEAAGWLRINQDTSQLQGQLWDPSVVAVAYYPQVINMLYQKSDWTQELGEAFASQSTDLLQAVQRLRAQAKSNGNLVTTPQQTVIVEGQTIKIVPASSSVIYVPQYNPTVVYTQPAPSPAAPLVAFGVGLAIGSAMDSSTSYVNWNTNTVVYHGYPSSYYYRGGSAQSFYGAGPRGYGEGFSAQGTGAYGNRYNTGAVAGRTWNGGAYAGTATTNQWQNGAKTGSFSASGAGPNGSASARGWGYQKGDTSAGGFSKSVDTRNGMYNVHGGGFDSGSGSGGSITASGINRQGDYGSKTWSGSNGSFSSTGHSGNLFSGASSGSYASNFSSRGASSRFGGESFDRGSFGGGGFSRGSFGGGGFGGGGGRFRR